MSGKYCLNKTIFKIYVEFRFFNSLEFRGILESSAEFI